MSGFTKEVGFTGVVLDPARQGRVHQTWEEEEWVGGRSGGGARRAATEAAAGPARLLSGDTAQLQPRHSSLSPLLFQFSQCWRRRNEKLNNQVQLNGENTDTFYKF